MEVVTNSNDTIKTDTCTFKANGGFLRSKVYNVILTIKQGSGGQTPTEEGDPLAVDLGLSVLWAKANIGANIDDPTDVDETETSLLFTWGGINGYTAGHNFTKTTDELYKKVGGKDFWLSFKDAAKTFWGDSWRLPTRTEFTELINNTTHQWYDNYEGSGVSGMLFTSKKEGYTNKSIFMPATGCGRNSSVVYPAEGFYWSSDSYSTDRSYYFDFSSSAASMRYQYRYYGCAVRAVKPKN